ncbi:GDSL-type esterase/lipase family protein [Thalassotalea agariperforans]
MKNNNRYTISIKSKFLAILVLLCSFSVFAEFVSPDANNIRYVGRIDHLPSSPFLTWPGSQIEFKITGNKLVIHLDDQQGKNYFNVIFNGKSDHPYVLAAEKGKQAYDLSHMLTNATNHIKIFKRTEGEEGGTLFLGIDLEKKAKLLPLSPAPNLKLVFYGDSVTVGMGNEAAHNSKDDKVSEKNHYLSYASITARNLNAQHHTIAKSGIGFMVSWFDFIMPEYYDQLTAENNNDSKWDFSQYQADIVVVNLGQNDTWLINSENKLKASPAEIIQEYKKFIKSLVTKHPNAKFVCALGSMDVTENNTWPDYIKQAVTELKQELPFLFIKTLNFDFTGYRNHPRVDQHYANAKKLTNFINSHYLPSN